MVKCPLCEKGCEAFDTEKKAGRVFSSFRCDYFPYMFFLDHNLIRDDLENVQFIQTMIVDDLLRRRYGEYRLPNYCLGPVSGKPIPPDDFIDATALRCWSSDHIEKVDRALMNLYLAWQEKAFELGTKMVMRCLLSHDYLEGLAMGGSLVDFGYISSAGPQFRQGVYIIASKGWQRIKELHQKASDKTAFIAISFDGSAKEIQDTIKKAIAESGFEPILINEVEHNNQIVPEIISHIRRCRFLVMDCTIPNNGAYYEAGMATGYGKEVIICCRKEEFDSDERGVRPHFDIAQKSTVVWKDLDDLRERLLKRIESTVRDS